MVLTICLYFDTLFTFFKSYLIFIMKELAVENPDCVSDDVPSNLISLSDRMTRNNVSRVREKRADMLEILRGIKTTYTEDDCAQIVRRRISSASVVYEGDKIYAHAPGKPRKPVHEFLRKAAQDALSLLDEQGEAILQSQSSSD